MRRSRGAPGGNRAGYRGTRKRRLSDDRRLGR